MSSQVKEIMIGNVISHDLALRASAAEFFDDLNRMPNEEIIIDFTGIRSITRSFAHEYIARKLQCKKTIVDRDVPENVRKMFEAVKGPGEKARVLDVTKVKVLTL